MPSYTKQQNAAMFILRAIIAATFLYAAYVKLSLWSGMPEGMSVATGNLMKFLSIVEPLGAAAVLLGFLTRYAATGLSVIMVGAIFFMQFVMGAGFATPVGVGWNFPLMVLGGCLILVVFGAGDWSVDAQQKK